jgi:hypothetical protein
MSSKALTPIDLLSFRVERVSHPLAAELIEFLLDTSCSPDVAKPVVGEAGDWFGREDWNEVATD